MTRRKNHKKKENPSMLPAIHLNGIAGIAKNPGTVKQLFHNRQSIPVTADRVLYFWTADQGLFPLKRCPARSVLTSKNGNG